MSPELLKAYKGLSEREKAVLYIIALAYFRVSGATISYCLSSIEHFSPKITAKDLSTHLASLKGYGFLDGEGNLHKGLRHLITLEAVASEFYQDYVRSLRGQQKRLKDSFYGQDSYQILLCSLRLAVYENDQDTFLALIGQIRAEKILDFLSSLFLQEKVDIDWIESRFYHFQQTLLQLTIQEFCTHLPAKIPPLLAHYKALRENPAYAPFNQTFLWYDILRADFERVEKTLEQDKGDDPHFMETRGVLCFLRGNNAEAIINFEIAIKRFRKRSGNSQTGLSLMGNIFYMLALFGTNDDYSYKKIHGLLHRESNSRNPIFVGFQNLLFKLQEIQQTRSFWGESAVLDPLSTAMMYLQSYWMHKHKVRQIECKQQFLKFKDTLPLVGYMLADILSRVEIDTKVYEDYLQDERFQGLCSLVACIPLGEGWKRGLNKLNYYFEHEAAGESTSKRLVWHFNPANANVTVLEQTLRKVGWNKGKPMSFYRLGDLDYLTEEDIRVLKTIKSSGYIDSVKTPLALVGHPRVYQENKPDLQLSLVEGKPELVIKQLDDEYLYLTLSHDVNEFKVLVEKEGPALYRIIHCPKSMLPLREILGPEGMRIPVRAKDQVLAVIQKASPRVPIQLDLELFALPAQAGDVTPCVQVMPYNEGLRINLLVRPFVDQGPYFSPGHGKAEVRTFGGGQHLRAKRNLKEEATQANGLIKACPQLERLHEGNYEWIVEDVEGCLEILSDLQQLQIPHKVEWPEGTKLSVTKNTSFDTLTLKIRKEREWFKVSGSLQVDEDTVIDFNKLLELLSASGGRFIPLENNKFIALSNHFRKQLEHLKVLVDTTKDEIRIHALGSHSFKTFTDQVGEVDSDEAWKEKIRSFEEANAYEPQLPTTLKAELRDYQRAGFEWVSRLFYLGVGACLADDMGLGKTIQALAVMLTKAPQGPCLVIAPTSVCHNWVMEIERFAPTLRVHTFEGGNRQEIVDALKEMDVLICSYSLLQQEAEMFSQKPWQMIVLDEAQFIKNANTKRFQAVINLQAPFKLALTGTPIENSLEELWSLFQFINPGLLRSQEDFRQRFLIPIERAQNIDKRIGFKNLIQMFILRRTKNMVLTELPPRTDQTILVDMDPEEASFYEALRRRALENISNLKEKPGQRKIHILAELTRLRRACCHASLAQSDINIVSSKMKAFLELIDEILENNHQVLVFSQYVGYLEIVRKALEDQKIAYQYLDGSTSAPERKKQVESFQEGQSSVFLLSLRAGGTGLNLTAADYVIHLDPWWNPAVEDQASDRAHRLGQKRAVTIYRLIVKETIEEKILKLHQDKRAIAEEFLEGSHKTGKMSEEDLIQLMT